MALRALPGHVQAPEESAFHNARVSFETFVRARASGEATGVGILRNDTPLSKQAGLRAVNSLGAHIRHDPHTFQTMYNSHAYWREEFCTQEPRSSGRAENRVDRPGAWAACHGCSAHLNRRRSSRYLRDAQGRPAKKFMMASRVPPIAGKPGAIPVNQKGYQGVVQTIGKQFPDRAWKKTCSSTILPGHLFRQADEYGLLEAFGAELHPELFDIKQLSLGLPKYAAHTRMKQRIDL